MIPLHLRISGFLSYRDPAELNFDSFELACISGQNGAGKSSLLDSITWVLFGEARGKGADIINLHPDVMAAEVALIFKYEGNVYRVQRTLPRGKNTLLEFQVLADTEGSAADAVWKPLTERTTRETQACIEQTLRLDHETFINASFFLQGKADQFTQKNASERKAVLSTILGLEIWDTYKERAAGRRKVLENDINEIDGRTTEIDTELAEEDVRKSRLLELENALKQLAAARAAQESALENIRKNAAVLDAQRKLAGTLSSSLERLRQGLASLEARLAEKETSRSAYAGLIRRAKEIESAYKAWQKSRDQLADWDKTAAEFREYDEKRQPLRREIDSEEARLTEEKRSLLREEEINDQRAAMEDLSVEIRRAGKSLEEAEKKVKERLDVESQRNAAREKQAELRVENDALKAGMNGLKERIEALKSAEGTECPLCGQPLSREHRKTTLKQLEDEGKAKGDQFRTNKKETENIERQIKDHEQMLARLADAESERLRHSNTVSQLTERIESLQSRAKEWEKTGKKRLLIVTKELEKASFAADSRRRLARLDKELARLGYEAVAHDKVRQEEIGRRGTESDFIDLERAREGIKQIQDEIQNAESEIAKRRSEISEQEGFYEKAARVLAESEAQAPDIIETERQLFTLREDENRTRDQVGAARQKVEVLATLRARKAEFERQREEINQHIVRHKTLERAFGKDGVPALLIEQSLPQIEAKANDLLERLSDGQMSIRFVTQESYKDKKRDELRETLDIQISDPAGMRGYEMYSGGEAFRVNFAIRLALSEILAQRKGARLQTLVIDEGFGSQDSQGRQRLIEAINIIKNDFAKILVITHLDELKDAFPNRIEVEKTERGSIVHVI